MSVERPSLCSQWMASINTNMDCNVFEQWPSQSNFLNRVLKENRLAHAYAFSGVDQLGKEVMVEFLLQSLILTDEGNQENEASQQIRRRIADKQFPDVYYLQAEGQYIKVDQIRNLKEWLATSPVEADFKMAVIEQAELMNTSAANALLTFLEEPSENVYLILLCSDLDKLLPTIQSRVQEINFPRRDHSETLVLGQDKVEPAHQVILQALPYEISQEILSEYQSTDFQKWVDTFQQFYQGLLIKDPMVVVQVQVRLKPYLSVKQSLQGLEYLWLLNYSLLNQDYQAKGTFSPYFIQQIYRAGHYQPKDLLHLDQNLLMCKQKILANVSPQLAYEQLAIRSCR